MQQMPQVIPISDLRTRQDEVLAMAEHAPLILAQRSTPRVVVVSIQEWNKMAQIYEAMKGALALEAEKRDANIDADDYLNQLAEIHGIGERVSA